HWSHTFEYALAAGPGDWRSAGFPLAGQDYNHDLLATETTLHGGPLPAAASLAGTGLADTGPAGAPVSALEPRPPPWPPAPHQPGPGGGVVVGRRHPAGRPGRPAPWVFLSPGGPGAGPGGRAGGRGGPPLPVRDGAAWAEVPAAGTVTMVLTP